MNMRDDLVRVCRVMNEHRAEYLVIGGNACALNGYVRATEDIDLLVKDDDVNLERTISAIKTLLPGIKEEITTQDIRDNIVLKILDEIEIDISINAWSLDYNEGLSDKKTINIDGVDIPYIGIDALIKSKSTYREIDQWDVKILNEIKKSEKK